MVTDTKFYPVDGFYKSFLETERERLNREFLSMKQYYPSLRSEEFKEVLFRLNPIINELETETKENITEIANFLYSSSLKFLAKELIGPQSKYPYFSHSWQQLLQAKELYSVSVIDLLSSLGNAVYNLCILNQMDAGNWLQTLQGIAKKHTTKDEILQAGKISAWIVGLPQYRNSALELCLETETSLLEDIFSVKITESYNILKEVFYEMYKDPWLRFELALKGNLKKRDIVLKKAGGFIGYGGKFRGIPTVQSLNSEFIISSGEEDFRLYADIYGTAVFRVKMEELLSEPWQETEEPGHFLSPEGTLSMGSVQKRFLELKNVHSIASNPHTLLACNRYSYYVFIAGAI